MYATDYTTIHNARCIADATDRKSAAAGAVHNRAVAAAAGAFSKTSFKHR